MTIPKLKRIKVSTVQELRSWLASDSTKPQDVMIVTCNQRSQNKYVSSQQVRDVATETGWRSGRSYTLDGNLVGHIVSKA